MKTTVTEYLVFLKPGLNGIVKYRLEGDPAIHSTNYLPSADIAAISAILSSGNAFYDSDTQTFGMQSPGSTLINNA